MSVHSTFLLALAVQLQRQESALAGAAADDANMMAEEDQEGEEEELTYEQMLELGEQIGDVKKERWKGRASKFVDALPQRCYVVPSTPEASAASSIEASYVESEVDCGIVVVVVCIQVKKLSLLALLLTFGEYKRDIVYLWVHCIGKIFVFSYLLWGCLD